MLGRITGDGCSECPGFPGFPGEIVEVEVELDTQPRIVEVPDDLAAALAAEPDAQAFYATLNYSAQRRYVEPIGEARTDETRARQIAKVVDDLKAGKK